MIRLLLTTLLFLFYVGKAQAVQCSAIFPGPQTFAANGSTSINSSNTCNGSSCSSVPGFTTVSLPSISPSSSFTTTSISDGVYESTSWGLAKESVVTFSGTGTAVLYFSGNVTIPKETKINQGGDPENVLIVVYGSLSIAKESVISANIYVAGSATINKENNFSGAISAGGALTVDKDGTYNFSSTDVSNLSSHGFCDNTPVTLDHYEIEHDGSGSICSVEAVTIKACANADCSSLYTSSTSVDFLAGGSLKSSPTFTGSTTVNFSNSSQGNVALSLANPSVAADNADACDNTSGGTSCNMSFDTTGCLDCNAIFPGSLPFAQSGAVSYDLKENVSCNGGNDCSLQSMTATASPVIPSGGSNLGSFNTGTLSDQAYNYYTSWNSSRTNVTVSSGTAVLYFDGNGNDIIIPENSQINASGSAHNLLIVVTDGKLIVQKNSTVNAYIYADTSETKFEENTTFNGAVSVISGTYIVEKDSSYNYTTLSDTFNPHGFCAASGPQLELHLNFDEGSGQTIADDSGNGRNGTLGSSGSADSQDPTFTCEASGYYMDFDRTNNEHVITPSFTPPADGVIAFWLKVPALPSSRQRIFGFGDGYEIRWESDDIMYIDVNKTDTNTSIRTSAAITTNQVVDNWLHVAVVTSATNNTWSVYLNGVLDNSGSETLTAQAASVLTIGGSTWRSTSEHLTGSIDDFRIYSGVLTAQEIAALAATAPSDCTPTIHHFEIVHDGQGLTCAAEPITIRACENAGCTILSSDSVTLDIKADGNTFASPTITTGSATVNLSHTLVETLTLSVDNPTITPSNAFECVNGASSSCDIIFSDAGFRFLYGGGLNIDNQIAGTIFPQTLQLQAVKDTDGVCTGIFNGNVNVALSQENISPSGSGGLNFQVNSSNIAKHPSTSTVSLNFDATSTATITNPRYLDAGQIRLNASYSDSGISLSGSSNSFWVRPHQLVIDHNAADPHKAGETFNFTVTAYNSLGTADANKTLNYQPSNMLLDVQRTIPVSGENGAFTYASGSTKSTTTSQSFSSVTLTNFSGGSSTFNGAKYSEVGTIQVDVKDQNYGGINNFDIDASAETLGRFIPAYFTQTVKTGGTIVANHGIGCSIESWVYSGQTVSGNGPIEYLIRPVLEITALNNDNNVTKNYTGALHKITDTSVTLGTVSTTHANAVPITGDVSSTNNVDVFDAGNGVIEYTLSDEHHFRYTKNLTSKVAPFDATFVIPIDEIKDGDNVTIRPSDSGTDYFESINFSSGVSVLFGRLVIEDNFGPETESLPLSMQTHNWNGSDYVVNTNDSCTTPIVSTKVETGAANSGGLNDWGYRLVDTNGNGDTIQVSHTNATISPASSFSNGIFDNLSFGAPGAGNTGALEFEYEVPDWLKSDWVTDNDFSANPTATMSFGLFRGNDRIIHWRELSN